MPVPVAAAAWEAFFAENPDPCFAYEVGTDPRFTLVAANPAWFETTGFSRNVLGRPLSELMPPQDAAVAAQRFERCVAEREPASFDQELRVNGYARHWRTSLSPLVIDGAVRYVLGFGHDYTDLRHTTNALAESEAKFRRLVENAIDVIYRLRIEPSVGFDYISPSIELVTGHPADDFYRNPALLRSLIHPDDLPRIDRTPDELREDRGIILARWRHKDGSFRWVEARSTGVMDASGKIVAREGIARDVTEQKRRDEERELLERRLQQTQKLESLGVLAGGIAHDFNNLLTGILGHSSLLRMHPNCHPELAQHAEHVEIAAARAADLCRQMLAYSGRGRFAVRRLELDALVRETTQLLKLSISKSTSLELALSAPNATVEADATQLQQVIMNLVLNASEACEDHPGHVRVTTGVTTVTGEELREAFLEPDLPGGNYVFVEVADDGGGMSPETLPRIFDPFFTTKFTGRGLGLSAVLGIVRGHAGAIRVESTPGRGTKFRVLLPENVGEVRSVESSRRPPEARGSGRLLVVDDEEIVRTVTARILTALGYTVVTAADGREAIDAIQTSTEPIDGVLMDLTMPNLDGVAALEELRRLECDVPVILMSGYNEQDAVARFAGGELAGFLQKPFSAEALGAKVGRALRKR
jgi:two-component system, cell cycle sensor histidine kinase and response regulator CckA